MPHQYKRRTLGECRVIAQRAFREQFHAHMTEEQAGQFAHDCCEGANIPPSAFWAGRLGYEPDPAMHYEFVLETPVVRHTDPPRHVWARILVSRDRASDFCVVAWHPEPAE